MSERVQEIYEREMAKHSGITLLLKDRRRIQRSRVLQVCTVGQCLNYILNIVLKTVDGDQ